MSRHYWDKASKEWVEYDHRAPGPERVFPFVMSDTPAYKSPIGTGLIDGRAARREDLKRSGCREVDPSEVRPTYVNKEFAKKIGREWHGPDVRAQRMPTIIGPDVERGER